MADKADPAMDAWIRSAKKPSRWRRFLARLGLVRQGNLATRGKPEELPASAYAGATVELSDETIAEYERQDGR